VVRVSLLLFSCVCKNLDACKVLLMDMQVLVIPWSCAGFYEWLVVMLMMLLVELVHWLLVLALLPPVACPAPPCAWLPTLPTLHLLGAWPALCCFWSWLSNHVALALVMGFDWWGELPLDAQLMSRENLCYAGAVCYGVGAGAGRLGFLVDQFCTHSTVLYHPWVLMAWHLSNMHLVTSCFLAWWLGRPDWFLADICVWVMLIRSTSWWLSTVLHLNLTATCITMVAFLFVFSFVCRW
jgi:hypothetical protein